MMPLKHRRAAVLLVLAVVAAHVFFTDALLTQLAELAPDSRAPDRIDVNFVSEVRLSAPPKAAAPPPAKKKAGRPKPKALPPPDDAASAPPPEAVASAPTPGASSPEAVAAAASAASQPEAPASSASSAVAAASAPQPAASSVATAKPFEWPASTRIKFKLNGQYNGEVQGSAQLDWLLSGTHYQVHVDMIVGPKFAPILRQSMSSDGEVSADGLTPRRYDEETKFALAPMKHKFVVFDANEVELSVAGKREPRLPGVQDFAGLIMYFTYTFTTKPDQLAVGNSFVIPMAWPRKQQAVNYDVVGTETLDTPLGALPTVHVKPRVPPRPGKPDVTVELWFAPNLEYLPVRMRFWQDERNYADLLIDGPPLRGQAQPKTNGKGSRNGGTPAASQPSASAP